MSRETHSYIASLTGLQLEISNKCNALCPGCIRTDSRTLNRVRGEFVNPSELPISLIEELFRSQFSTQLREIEFCGTLDEPLAHSKFLEILSLILSKRADLKISIHTNGSLRDEKYFEKLADLLKIFDQESVIRFSIDGLADTNEIYRYKTSFSKIMNNLSAFISGGGRAIWQSVVFPWNQHQVQEMKALAKSMGCVAFYARPDRTFVSKLGVDQINLLRSETQELKYKFPKGDPQVLENIYLRLQEPVQCIYKENRKMLFLSWDGRIWPCCFWSNLRFENEEKRRAQHEQLFIKYGNDFNKLESSSLDEVLQSSFFEQDLVKSWASGEKLKWRCTERCSASTKRSSDGKIDDKKHFEQIYFS